MKSNAALLGLLLVAFGAAAKTPPLTAEQETAVAKSVAKSVTLPLDGIAAVTAKDGKNLFVSTNGRYEFIGSFRDIYTNKVIRTPADAMDARYLTLEQMSLSAADIASIPFGNPNLPMQARVFVDPYCPECLKLFKQLEPLRDKVHLEILISPLAGKPSIVQGLRMWCAYEQDYNRGRDIITDLIKGPPYPKYPENPGCKGQRVMLNTMLTRVFNMPGVPAFWRADGFSQAGIPDDLMVFLNERRNTTGEKE